MEGGTEAFPELGSHCQHPDCNLLDFLPFTCNRCDKVFCLEHRTYKTHECPIRDEKNRKVVICQRCSATIETTGRFGADEKAIIDKHMMSKQCDPLLYKKPSCPVPRCKEKLTFSNNQVCKLCNIKVCLKHRFPADHACKRMKSSQVAVANGGLNSKILGAIALRNSKDCGQSSRGMTSPTKSSPSVKSF